MDIAIKENVCLEKLNKNGIQMFFFDLGKNEFYLLFHPDPRCFCFLYISLIIFSLLSSPPALSHHRQASWLAHHGAAEPIWPCGPSAPWKSSTDPNNLALTLRKPPRGGITLAQALLVPRRAPSALARQLHPRFCPWSHLPLRLEPRPPYSPSRL
jgi:hypothetical protein